jgi:hypothetical protein
MAAMSERDAALDMDTWHQLQKIRVAATSHASYRRAMMLAQLRQGRLKQNKIAQLLVKYGIASGHRLLE